MFFSPLLEERLRRLGRSTRSVVLRRAWSRLSILRANAVLFPTQAIMSMVETYTALGDKPCSVIHYGFDREGFFSGAAPEPAVLEPLKEWRSAGRKTLLYVSGYAIHKNFETAVEAFASLLAQGLDLGLVLTAARKDWYEIKGLDALQARIRELGIEARVHFTGEIPWQQIQPLYAAADLFVFPSFLESFGHPMVEAMASGLPIVAADTAVNREILDDAALYFSIFEADECASALRRCLDDTSLASRLREAALARSAQFSWRSHTEVLLAVLAGLARPATA
jgi:glycosyltransferase involved in cell wall biosynthesis